MMRVWPAACRRDGSVVVAVPLYRPVASADEVISLDRLFAVLGGLDIAFFHPRGMDVRSYARWPAQSLPLADRHFRSSAAYSRLLLSIDFYAQFANYEHVLIHQTDAFLCHDGLARFTDLNVDYIGAPWPVPRQCPRWCLRGARFVKVPGLTRRYAVGNGGLSLRRVRKAIEVIQRHPAYACAARLTGTHEDVYFASLIGECSGRLRIPPPEVAREFAFDRDPRASFLANGGRLPFGLHNPWGYDRDFFITEVLPRCRASGFTHSDV